MIDRHDVATLRQAGLDDIGTLVSLAADFVRRCPVRDPEPVEATLSITEREFLRSVGGRGADADEIVVAEAERTNLMTLAAEYAQLVASADSMAEVAERLGVKSSRIRQRIGNRSLYAIDTGGSRVFPRFQFSGAATLPGFGEVLGAFDPDTHPVAVARFFLTPTSDLESDLADGAVSPRDWLLAGLPAEPVVRLAAAP